MSIVRLKHEIERDKRIRHNLITANDYIVLLVLCVLNNSHDEISQIAAEAETYIQDIKTKEEPGYDTALQKYLLYIVSIFKGSPNIEMIKEHVRLMEAYYKKEIPLNKSNKTDYEDLITLYVEAREYEKAWSIYESLLSKGAKPKLVVSFMMEFLKSKQNLYQYQKEIDKLIKKIEYHNFVEILPYINVYLTLSLGAPLNYKSYKQILMPLKNQL